ncbi:glycosyltransferase [Paludisphaera mucosa]|uniref:Glycosyltransferase n=1 Tax=Paludisphaera mucosa TaxID=3030827 RepID=A0ABT6F8C3_9BACT|nr:glycosyltransferase [Paludisphaera mucosa]MDG3003848.1 glycosyltransferase [Paludisphaera mucosa]
MDASIRERQPGAGGLDPATPLFDAIPPALAGLRIALVHDWLTGMRGGEKCLEVLCRAFPKALLYTLIHRKGSTSPAIESMAIRTSPLQRAPGVFRYYRQLLPLMPAAAATWRLKNVDLVVSLSHCVAKSVRVPAGVPHVCYCFTPMRYAWQGRDAYLESWSDRPIKRAVARSLLNRLQDWDRSTATRVSHFVAISETIRDRIAGSYHRESAIIPPPVDTAYYHPVPTTPREDFYLVVSALVPYKRVDQAVAACRRSGRRLIVIGAGPDRARLEAAAGPGTTFLGWQSDEAIRDHYRRCRALLFPGEEDFGIVPVEALGCGSPVIALRRGGAAETVPDACGRLYDAPTADALAAAIDAWEVEGRPHDPAFARAQAETFALPVFRRRLLGLLADVAASKDRHAGVPRPHIAAPGVAGRRRRDG